MAMSRKDYQAIADAIAATRGRWTDSVQETETANAIQELVERLEDYFAKDNEQFDSGRFMWACVPRIWERG